MKANQKEVTEEMRKLIKELTDADTAYYKHDDPLMTDREYDGKLDRLRNLGLFYPVPRLRRYPGRYWRNWFLCAIQNQCFPQIKPNP